MLAARRRLLPLLAVALLGALGTAGFAGWRFDRQQQADAQDTLHAVASTMWLPADAVLVPDADCGGLPDVLRCLHTSQPVDRVSADVLAALGRQSAGRGLKRPELSCDDSRGRTCTITLAGGRHELTVTLTRVPESGIPTRQDHGGDTVLAVTQA